MVGLCCFARVHWFFEQELEPGKQLTMSMVVVLAMVLMTSTVVAAMVLMVAIAMRIHMRCHPISLWVN
jgi:hypothetical protein